ncbi:MAG: TolC family protein [Parabacteroides merdae]
MDHNTYSLGATVSQPIYAGGQIYNNYKAAQIQGQIASEAEDLTTDNIVYAADLNYWSAAARKKACTMSCASMSILCRNWQTMLTTRFNDGQISKTDLLQVQSRLKEAELNKSAAYKDYQIALQNLNVLMGVPPMTPVEIADAITTVQPLPMHIGKRPLCRTGRTLRSPD